MLSAVAPPIDEEDLVKRARSLGGKHVAAIAESLGIATDGDPRRTKGTPGAILELALGASGGSTKIHDFPELGIELKTIPVTPRGAPIESTFVCTLSLVDAEEQEWATSWVRAKLQRILFVPLVGDDGIPWRDRSVGTPIVWSPTPEQDDVLRGDFDDVVGLVGVGRIEELTAHLGRWLQVRPKAAHGRVRTTVRGAEGETIATIPRGFYLRARFTGAILADPTATPE